MPTRRSFIGTSIHSGSIYAVGGYDGTDYLTTVEKYDGVHDVWVNGPQMSSPRSCCGVATFNDCIYVAGGYNTDHCIRTVEKLDPRIGMWLPVSSLSMGRSYLSMVTFNDALYAVGGLSDTELAVDVVEKYEVRMNKWVECDPLINCVYACGLTVLNENM